MQWLVTDNIYRETWHQLLEYSNAEITIDLIAGRHGGISASQRKNFEKQAQQARFCVLQAKEYFDAATNSSIYTAPNHAYYGAVALASLVMLMTGDGRFSLDMLRKDSANNHHGLDFTTGCSAKSATQGLNLIEDSRSEILGRGHFSNWYRLIPARAAVLAPIKIIAAGNRARQTFGAVGGFQAPDISELAGKKMVSMELIKYLPDLDQDLARYGVAVPRCQVPGD